MRSDSISHQKNSQPRSQTLFGNAVVLAVTQPERARPGFPTLFPCRGIRNRVSLTNSVPKQMELSRFGGHGFGKPGIGLIGLLFEVHR